METWLTVNQVLTEVLIDYGLRALIDTWKRILLAHIDAINLALWVGWDIGMQSSFKQQLSWGWILDWVEVPHATRAMSSLLSVREVIIHFI